MLDEHVGLHGRSTDQQEIAVRKGLVRCHIVAEHDRGEPLRRRAGVRAAGWSCAELTKEFATFTVVDPPRPHDSERPQLFALLGPSGCGKTTTLRMVAGLENPSAGQILLGCHRYRPRTSTFQRPVNTVFQTYAFFPHLTSRMSRSGRAARRRPDLDAAVDEALALV